METTSPNSHASPLSRADSNPSLSRTKFASPVETRHRPAAKRYGRGPALPVQDIESSDASGGIRSEDSVREIPETLVLQLEEESRSTSVIPETDQETSSRRVVMEGESQDSGPPSSSDRSNQHTTDPTTDDEADRIKMKPVQSSPTPPAFKNLSASSSDAEDNTVGTTGWASFLVGKSVKDIMNDDEDESSPAKKSATALAQTNLPPTSSSLASLTASEPSIIVASPIVDSFGLIPVQPRKSIPIIPSTSIIISDSSPTNHVLPRSRSITAAVSPPPAALFGDLDSEEEESVRARPKSTNTKKRIVDSDAEDDENEGGFVGMQPSHPFANFAFSPQEYIPSAEPIFKPIPNPFDPPTAPTLFEEDDEEDLPTDIRDAVPVLSSKQRLELLAAKKRAAMPAKVVEREASVEEMVEDSSEDERDRRKSAVRKPRKHKEDSKKTLDEINRGTAAALRSTAVGLERRHKESLNVRAMTAKAAMLPITAHARFDAPRLIRPAPKSASSDPIIVPSSTSHSTPHRATGGMSEKARGKLPELSSSVEIVPSTYRPFVETQKEEEEEDLPTLEELEAQAIVKKKADAYLAMKLRAANAQRTTPVVVDDSDDDLEIEAPPVVRKETTVADASQFPRLSTTQRKFQDLRGTAGAHKEESATDSQIAEAGHTFGTNLGPARIVSVSNFEKKKSVKSKKKVSAHHAATIGHDQLERSLMDKVRLQNAERRTGKLLRSRRNETATAATKKEEDDTAVDMSGMLERKKLDLEKGDPEEEDEDVDDGDFELVGDADSAHSGDEAGSASEIEDAGSSSNVENEDSDGADNVAKVRSAQGREPLGEILLSKDDDNKENEADEEGDETMMPAPPPPQRRRVILDDEESQESQSVVSSAVAPGKVQLPAYMQGNDDAGFSQFFGTAFSQDVGGDNQVEGFNRAPEIDLPDSTYLAPPLINNAERALDAARLDAMNAFRANALGTPKVAAPARRYINQQGFMTQTRPANPYEESPRDGESQRLGAGSYEASSFQDSFTPSQTQLESPSRTYANESNRLGPPDSVSTGLGSKFDSQGPTPTQIQGESQEATQIDSQAIPSAQPQRPPPNAFDFMRAAQNITTTVPTKERTKARAPNAFVDDQAHLSDEEVTGMGGTGSGDEDETLEDLDADLEGMVDHEKIDAEIEARQDALVREQVARDAAADDLARQTRAQRMIDGKERNGKRKAGNLDLSDDEFDDDGYGISRRDGLKQKRAPENPTMVELEANEETQAFAHSRRDGLTVIFKDDEHSNLTNIAESSDDDEDDTPAISIQESRRLAGEMSRRRKEATSLPETQTITINSSSPPPRQPRLNNRTSRTNLAVAPLIRAAESFDDIDSQYSNHKTAPLTEKQKRLYVQDTSKAEQNTSGQTGGAGSAVTGYRQSAGATKATYGKSLEGGKGGKAVAAAKTSKFKRSKFAK